MNLLVQWVVTGVALYAADYLLEGISANGDWRVYAVMALIFALVSLIAKPVLSLLSLPLIFITFGLFTLVVNAAVLWLASWVALHVFNVPFRVDGFVAAFLGSLIVSIVSTVLNSIVGSK